MLTANTLEAKTRLAELLQPVEKYHETVVICRNGTPVAEIVPLIKTGYPLQQHPMLKQGIIHEDPTLPLTDDDWPADAR